MALAKGRKLKVFQAQFGFYDSVVAVSSQAAALQAWGTHQNLFADGQAKLATDDAAIKAALAHPDTPLRRAVGSIEAFAFEPTSLPKVPDATEKPASAKDRKQSSSGPKAPPKPPIDRSKLTAAEADLRKLDEQRKQEETALRKKQTTLDEEVAKAQCSYVEARRTATANLTKVRQAYRSTGGKD